MKTLPPILIATDRGHFIAYRIHGDSHPEVLDSAVFSEATEKLSDQVTDRAGGFPGGGGIGGNGNSAAERPKLVAELEIRCVRHIADHIKEVLNKNSGAWAFAAPPQINGAILEHLPKELEDRLHLNVRKDIARMPVADLTSHFLQAKGAA